MRGRHEIDPVLPHPVGQKVDELAPGLLVQRIVHKHHMHRVRQRLRLLPQLCRRLVRHARLRCRGHVDGVARQRLREGVGERSEIVRTRGCHGSSRWRRVRERD